MRYLSESRGTYPEDEIYDIDPQMGNPCFTFGLSDTVTRALYLRRYSHTQPLLLGDVNRDGILNIADLLLLQKWLTGDSDFHFKEWRAADLNHDNHLTATDFSLLKHMLLAKS